MLTRQLSSTRRHRHIPGLLLVLMMLGPRLVNADAGALLPDKLRLGSAIGKYDGTSPVAAASHLRPPRRLRSEYLEFAIGVFSDDDDNPSLDIAALGFSYAFGQE